MIRHCPRKGLRLGTCSIFSFPASNYRVCWSAYPGPPTSHDCGDSLGFSRTCQDSPELAAADKYRSAFSDEGCDGPGATVNASGGLSSPLRWSLVVFLHSPPRPEALR